MTNITPDLLIEAYKIGVFPMANNQDDAKIDFFDPDPRGIIPLESFHVSRSLRKLIRKGIFKVTYDAAFPSILEGCSQTSQNRPQGKTATQIRLPISIESETGQR